MPSIPQDGTNGRLWNLVHANVRDAVSRSLYNISAAVETNDERPYGLHYFPGEDFTMKASSLGSYNSVNGSAIETMGERRALQILATVTSSISLITALLAMYWFCMMRRNFRRDLVLLLIIGGSWKSLWFMLYSVVTFTRGPIETTNPFCQVSGYGLVLGFESCDIAVLFMSIHMYLQIFPPVHSMLGHDGLYRIRHWVYATWFVVPNVMAALAFVNPREAYMAAGAFCFLPIRPFWYRLALFWIPRYLIWIYVVFVAVRIYRHVGSEFKVFGQEKDSSSSFGMPAASSIDRAEKADKERIEEKARRRSERLDSTAISALQDGDADQCAPDDVSVVCMVRDPKIPSPESTTPHSPEKVALRRQSSPNWATNNVFGAELSTTISESHSMTTSRRGSHQVAVGIFAEDFAPPPVIDADGQRGSVASLASKRSSTGVSFDAGTSFDGAAAISSIRESNQTYTNSSLPCNTANRAMQQRRRAIQRQLRLLFIYPCIYMILWVIPFVQNIFNYFNYLAQHPIFPIAVLQLFCLTIMTFADVFVFSWRERPWRHIPGSDGTFLGSLKWWEICFQGSWANARRMSMAPSLVPDEKDRKNSRTQSQAGLLASLKRWSLSRKSSSPQGSDAEAAAVPSPTRPSMPHKRTFSGGSDRKQLEAERAHERLALERAEYEQNRRSLQDRRASVISQQMRAASDRKEWFDDDRHEELFEDSGDREHDDDEKTGED